jgi:hypothetical protein
VVILAAETPEVVAMGEVANSHLKKRGPDKDVRALMLSPANK